MPRAMARPRPAPAAARGAGRLAAERHVEHARQVLRRDAAAGVGHGHAGHAALDVGQHLDAAVGRGVPDRVDHQVAQRPADLGRVDVHRHAAHRGPGEPHALGPGQRLGAGHRLGDQVVEADTLPGQPQRARVDPGQLEQVVDHHGEPVRPRARICAWYCGHVARVDHHLVLQRLGHRPQPGQRRAQVVADPGDELAAAGLQRALPDRAGASRSCAVVSSASSSASSAGSAGLRRHVDAACRPPPAPRRSSDRLALISRRPSEHSDTPSPTSPATATTVEHHVAVVRGADHASRDDAMRPSRQCTRRRVASTSRSRRRPPQQQDRRSRRRRRDGRDSGDQITSDH